MVEWLKGFMIAKPQNNINMHELKIAEDLAGIVIESALKEKLVKVTKVNISFGQLVQIVPEIFETAYRECVRDTIAEESELDIEIIRVRMKCAVCGSEFNLERSIFACATCGSADIKIVNGKEIFIKSIEGEKDGNQDNEEHP
jgi:hydrogenase nickel incorporation protein HypA/HybF